jgi:hypothetical protein
MSMKNMGSRIRARGSREKSEARNREGGESGSGDPGTLTEVTSNDGLLSEEDGGAGERARGGEGGAVVNGESVLGTGTYRVYKRRWFGLFQLALLNIIVTET